MDKQLLWELFQRRMLNENEESDTKEAARKLGDTLLTTANNTSVNPLLSSVSSNRWPR